jgi:hypothetical protein
MISIIGIGNAASAIAEKFSSIENYDIFLLNSKVFKNTKKEFKIKNYNSAEEYEENIPDLKNFFSGVKDRVQVFITGASESSNYTLGILEQIRDRKIDLFYIKPDTELLTENAQLLENVTFGVLQEYARSGLFKSITFISNLHLEKVLGEVPIKTYFDVLNESIFSTVHYLNFFEFTDPEIGQISRPATINRIRTIGMLDIENLEEKWLFNLDKSRELCYYICINEKRMETEGGLHKKLVDMLKEKPKNAYKKISYAIYETEHNDFGFCVAHTNVVQQQKTLDNLEQE